MRGVECAVLVILILLLTYLLYSGVPDTSVFGSGGRGERMVAHIAADGQLSTAVEAAEGTRSWVRLYEAPMQQDLAFELAPEMDYRGLAISPDPSANNGLLKQRIPVNLKSVDLNLPKTGYPNLDVVRKIEIWAVYGGDTIASTESDFYNSYLEPDWALRANPAKYRLVARVEPGQRVRGGVMEPTKSVLVIASL